MEIGFYAGSFDPFTNGHLHVIEKSVKIFDKVIIGIGDNPDKKRRFDKSLMKNLIEELLINRKLTNVEVICYENMTVDAAKSNNATFLVRGVRNGMDYDCEENMASINEEVADIDTIYIRAGKLGNISSSMVMDLLEHGKDVSKYLPKEIINFIKKGEKYG